MPEVIHFYSVRDEYGCFSNFAPYPVRMDGKPWPTSEHWFQAQKFAGTAAEAEMMERIRDQRSPMIAARLGRSRRRPIRANWHSVRDEMMRRVVRAKFTQHADIRAVLLDTGDATLVEHTENDDYWGDGGDGSGRNMLGRILMQVRAELRAAESQAG
jgi:ribA/ribD-fused uncharacterized protein